MPQVKTEDLLSGFTAKIFGLLVMVCSAVGVVLFCGYVFLRPYLNAYSALYLPALVLLITEIAFLNLNTVFQAGLRAREYAVFRITGSILRLALALVFVFYVTKDVAGLIAGAAVAQLLVVYPMARGLKHLQGGKRLRMAFDPGLLRTFAAYGLPIIGWTLGSQILALSDRFVIEAFRGSSEVGIYSANYNIVSFGFGLATTPLVMAAHPLIITAWEKKRRDEVPGIITEFSRIYVLVALLIIVLVSAFSAEIVNLLLGSQFREGHIIMPFVLAGVGVWGVSMFGHKGLEVAEKTRVMLSLVAVSAVVNVVLNLVFVPRYGYFAAAVTTAASYVLYPVFVYWISRSYLRWRIPWRAVRNAFAAATITGVTIHFGKPALPANTPVVIVLAVGGIFGFGLYAAVLLLLREITRNELNFFRVAKRR